MNCPAEFNDKTTAAPWLLVSMGGFVWVMSSLVAVELLSFFLPPKEWVDVGIFGAKLISAMCLVWFTVATGINIPAVVRDWWKHRAKHLQIVFKYFVVYAGFAILTIGVLVLILVLLEESGKINPLIAASTGDTENPVVQLKFFLNNSTPRFFLSMGTMCILAPLIEEIYFRRFLFVALRKKMNFPLALLISSILFTAVHPNMALGVIGGIYLGYVYEKGKSLPANILVHAMANFSITILSLAVMR